MKKVAALAILICLVFAAAISIRDVFGEEKLTDEEKRWGLSTVWQRARECYAYWPEVPGLDWDKAYTQAISDVLATTDLYGYYTVLSCFLALLGDGHSYIQMPEKMKVDFFYLPADFGYYNGKFIVMGTHPLYNAELELGSEVVKINGQPTEAYLEARFGAQVSIQTPNARQAVLVYLLQKSTDATPLQLDLVTPLSDDRQVILNYTTHPVPLTDSLYPPVEASEFSYQSIVVGRPQEGIIHVRIPAFQDPAITAEFQDLIDQTKDTAKAYLLDVRGNHGGNAGFGLTVLSHFIAEEDLNQLVNIGAQPATAPTAQTPAPAPKETAGVRAELLPQPVMILCDHYDGSAGEDFVAYAKGCKNVTVIGSNTRGTTGSLASFDLPGGGALYLSSYRTLLPDGTVIHNRGVQPDIWSEYSVSDLLRGKDTVLEAALDFLGREYGLK